MLHHISDMFHLKQLTRHKHGAEAAVCFGPQGFLGEKEEFLLFASLFEVTMLDPSVGTRPLKFELSIGKQHAVGSKPDYIQNTSCANLFSGNLK